MKPESRALAQALIDHHRAQITRFPPGKLLVQNRYTIRYGQLCERAGVAHLTRIVGSFLLEIAEWCAASGHPPLNALAVNDSGMPGDGYDGAGGFPILEWPKQLDACVRYKGYPIAMP